MCMRYMFAKRKKSREKRARAQSVGKLRRWWRRRGKSRDRKHVQRIRMAGQKFMLILRGREGREGKVPAEKEARHTNLSCQLYCTSITVSLYRKKNFFPLQDKTRAFPLPPFSAFLSLFLFSPSGGGQSVSALQREGDREGGEIVFASL